ncbi:MAG: hypothetical protein SNG49_01220 [Rikenellaceae bacterium]
MKFRQISVLFLALFSFVGAYANGAANAILKEVLANIEAQNPYRVKIEVSYANSSMIGFYEVDHDAYYISIDQQELYGDTNVKYEVFNSRKEVIIDTVRPDNNGNLLNNPATAFSSIRDHYSAEIITENSYFTTLELKPNSGDDSSIETIELSVSNATKLPIEILYKFGGEQVVIKVVEITQLSSSITLYDSDKYADYEIIDFR